MVHARSDVARRAYRDCRPDYDRGVIAGNEYWSRVLEHAGATHSAERTADLIRLDIESWTEINQEVLSLVSRLHRAGVFLALLSNLPTDHQSYFVSHFDWLKFFPVCVFSCETGYAKPQPEIYGICLDRLEVPAEKCLFVDDTEKNVAAARKMGVKSTLFNGVGSLEKELQSHLAVRDF
jgi:putative hydrolase of the HAD superfamily